MSKSKMRQCRTSAWRLRLYRNLQDDELGGLEWRKATQAVHHPHIDIRIVTSTMSRARWEAAT
jgi:hypothetical protein